MDTLTAQDTNSSTGQSGSSVASFVISRLKSWMRLSTLPISQWASPGAIHSSMPRSEHHLATACER